MDTLTYVIEEKIYINLTNRCSNNCVFCIRNNHDGLEGYGMKGYNLWLNNEPCADDIIKQLELFGVANFNEVVFCGFGEPIYRWDEIKQISEYVHKCNGKTRINTNGQAKLILGYDITWEIGKYIDTVNVSLNATDATKYQEVCCSVFGSRAYDVMLEFARNCVKNNVRTVLSVVDCIGKEEIEKAKFIANEIGAELRIRNMID